MTFSVIQSDITNIPADAIVLPANESLKEGSGASSAIFEKAGRRALTKACDQIGHCDTGKAVPTLAFHLKSKFIIHAVVPKWIDGNQNEYEYLSSAYLSALNIADVMGCHSIAFPLLASGNNGFNLELAFEIAKNSIESFNGENLKEIILVAYGHNTTAFLRSKGITVENSSEISTIKHENPLFKEAKEGAKLLGSILAKEAIERAIKYMKDPKNQKKIFDVAKTIVTNAFKIVAKK